MRAKSLVTIDVLFNIALSSRNFLIVTKTVVKKIEVLRARASFVGLDQTRLSQKLFLNLAFFSETKRRDYGLVLPKFLATPAMSFMSILPSLLMSALASHRVSPGTHMKRLAT